MQEANLFLYLNGNIKLEKPCSTYKQVIDKIHHHVYGVASFTDMKLLLQRNNIWYEKVKHYIGDMLPERTSCRASTPSQPSRMVSISSLFKEFNDSFCVDHFFLDYIYTFHCMDVVTRFSSGHIISSAGLYEAILAFEKY